MYVSADRFVVFVQTASKICRRIDLAVRSRGAMSENSSRIPASTAISNMRRTHRASAPVWPSISTASPDGSFTRSQLFSR